jgi:hypothetical protein
MVISFPAIPGRKFGERNTKGKFEARNFTEEKSKQLKIQSLWDFQLTHQAFQEKPMNC